MARFIYTRSYEAQLDINLDAVEELRELSRDHLLLFLWSHKSHMDSFVFLLSLYEQKFRPLPLIFAGINMNFLGFGALARRVGAIFLRRTFHEDPVYKLVFRRYIDYLISHKAPLSWSIEGTRSRTGKLSPPKLGILNWVVESCHREDIKDVLLVPVSIAFDRIAEIDDYVAIQTGQPKRKESLRWFIDYKPTTEFWQDVMQETQQHYPHWDSGEHSIQKLLQDRPPRFGHAILRSITESYLVIAVSLLELEDQPVDDQRKFTRHLLAQGEQMLLRRTISCESSVSRDLFSTGLRLAQHLQLLEGNDVALSAARDAFATRVVAALSAINLLQRSYDAAWFSQLSAGKVANLHGA